MFEGYPSFSEKVELATQAVIGIALLFQCVVYFMGRDAIFGPDALERLSSLSDALSTMVVAFLLALLATFFRKWTKEMPMILIWVALLLSAGISAISASLLFASSL